jgi:glycogen operon protein
VRLGSHLEGDGVRFAVFSTVADAVVVCDFDEGGRETRHALELGDASVWRAHVPGTGDATRYGFGAHGPWDPAQGLRCNAAKLLLDPYARSIRSGVEWNPAVAGDDPADSAPFVPRSVVHDAPFDWATIAGRECRSRTRSSTRRTSRA